MPYNVKGEQRNTGRTHFKVGYTPWNKGKRGVYSDETLRKMGDSPYHQNLKNKAKYPDLQRVYQTSIWRKLSKQVFIRDGYICQSCGILCNGKFGRERAECHHIDYDIEHNVVSNLITLCASCHGKTRFKKEDWKNYFLQKVRREIVDR